MLKFILAILFTFWMLFSGWFLSLMCLDSPYESIIPFIIMWTIIIWILWIIAIFKINNK